MTTNGRIRIAAVGDIALNGAYTQLARRPEMPGVLDGVASLLRNADLAIGNLEGALTERPSTGRSSRFCLRGHPRYASVLRAAGFHVLSLANNHILDFGWEATEETLNCLEAAGIHTVGVGRNLDAARKPIQLSVNGITISILAYCGVPTGLPIFATDQRPGVAPARAAFMIEDIAKARKNCDFLVVCLHWGQEYVGYPTPSQRRSARRLVSAGANLILGHHPHVLQGWENLSGGLVTYSLGNFAFAEEEWTCTDRDDNDFRVTYKLNDNSRRSAVLNVDITKGGNIVGQEVVPVYLGVDLRTICDSRPERVAELERSRAALTRPGYLFLWTIRMLRSRARAQADEVSQGSSIWKRLHRLRPRHIRDAVRLIAREWQHLRGVK